jgi:hypothetical protein
MMNAFYMNHKGIMSLRWIGYVDGTFGSLKSKVWGCFIILEGLNDALPDGEVYNWTNMSVVWDTDVV